ncbi:MAG: ABC transporter ATP-binding protein, partial [Lachnospiraceae bacterium]|nr:ABC transporter ATP-binding protein [Lachnospiraceae bacterium]
LCRQARERQAALIFSTHDAQLAKDYADVIWKLEGGVLHACSQPGL